MRKLGLDPVTVRLSDIGVTYDVVEVNQENKRGRRRRKTVVEALQGVSFELVHGDALGIVGNNGAGKSTLIQVVAGSIVPTSGTVEVSALPQRLNVQWALNPAVSGRRNVYLGLLAQGLYPARAKGLIDQVIEISEIGDAIDRPMRTYSAGMKSRLGFAIATVRVPEILLLDEALAVGDQEFRQKSLERVRDVRDGAGTVILASHSLPEIEQTCNKALWLYQGRAVLQGQPDEVLDAYRRSGEMDLEENLWIVERARRKERQARQERRRRALARERKKRQLSSSRKA